MAVVVTLIVVTAAHSQKPTLYVQTGHEGPINSIVYSPDGRLIASGGDDKAIKLWDVKTKREIRTFAVHDGPVTAVAFDPTSTMIASSGADGRVIVSEVATGAPIWSTGRATPFLAVAFSPDGRYLAAYSTDITVWEARTWREVRRFKSDPMLNKMAVAFGARSVPLGFSSDSNRIFALSEGQPKSFDIVTGKKLRTFKEFFFTVLAVSPDGHFLALGSKDSAPLGGEPPQFRNFGSISVFDTVTGKLVKKWEAHAGDEHSGDVTALTFSYDGKLLASAGSDRNIKLWEVATWREIRSVSASKDSINSISFSRDNRSLASASGSGSVAGLENGIKLWKVETGQQAGNFAGRTNRSYGITVSPDGRRLAYITTNTRTTLINIWDLKLGQKIHVFEVSAWLFSIVFSPDGTRLLGGCRDGTAKLFDANSGQLITVFRPHNDTVFSAAFSRDGKRMATACGDKTIRVWDVSSGSVLRTLTGHTDEVLSVAFNPRGDLLASTGMDKSIRLWDVNSGTQIKSLIDPVAELQVARVARQPQLLDLLTKGNILGGGVVAFSPDGQILAASVGGYGIARIGNEEKAAKLTDEIRIYDVASGAELHRLTGLEDTVQSLSFSSDGQRLASGGADKVISIWEVATGRRTETLKNNLDFDTYAAFVPNGNLVAGVSRGLLSLWDAGSGQLLATMTSIKGSNEWLVVTPDGLFDGSPQAWHQLLWRFSERTLDVLSVESYFGEFFYPNLLADIYAGERPKSQAEIEDKDRRQPSLKVSLAETNTDSTSARMVKLKIEATEAPPDATHSAGSGVRDIRLFRNGSLVKAWRGDSLTSGRTSAELETIVPIVAGENVLTAYAFNRDNIKSEDATLIITGAETLRRQGTAYVLAIGINSYANSQYDLRFAVADAEVFGKEFRQQQMGLERFARVEVVPLFDGDATKANILLALKRLARSENLSLPPDAPAALKSIQSAQPEDAVIVYFAGHGTAQQNRFFLVPQDLGYQGSRTKLDRSGLDTILAHSISDRELEEALEQVDAGQILFIIDACNSGQALESDEKRRGPMNSKGLAQLAYEKGMYIMTAAQSYQAALETPKHGHGYLTYALVEEGLRTASADIDPSDGRVTVREWLDYATRRVPQLQAEDAERPRQSAAATQGQMSQSKVARTTRQQRGRQGAKGKQQQEAEKARQLEKAKAQAPVSITTQDKYLQQPRVFYRREAEPTPLVVARPN
ncbi:MAG TPA: caspase family protein [Pyrinomonadaceae bacterium]|jgi:WD40 repeat protein/uncharacterized caspase-like protein|nr:caspase family protein [Pyrinomonadaceae bacterium]